MGLETCRSAQYLFSACCATTLGTVDVSPCFSVSPFTDLCHEDLVRTSKLGGPWASWNANFAKCILRAQRRRNLKSALKKHVCNRKNKSGW